ncbi:anaphase promoting complex subunit cdc16 [Pleurotus pulmonarius]|nr:anaphase promoting complex subunit cdc16 [Pleurotus pulmonarius]
MNNPQKALQAKEKGNEAFKAGDYYAAIGHYTTAILNNRKDATFQLNRAAAYLKLGKNQDAERDCTTVLELSKNNLKALFRRGQARVGLEKYDAAKEDFEAIVKADPGNDAAKLELQKLLEIMEKLGASRAARAQILTPASGEPSTVRRRIPITIVDDTPVSDDLLKPVSTRPLNPSDPSSSTPSQSSTTRTAEPPRSEAKKSEVATPSLPPPKPASFKEAKQARDSIKPSRMGGGIFRPTGKHTVFTHVGPSVDDTPKPTMSLFDFARAMHSLSTASDKWKLLLDNIPPSTLPQLFKTSLEPPLLVSVFEMFRRVESLGAYNFPMATPPPPNPHGIPPFPNVPSPSGSRNRGSIGSSFSFGPQYLVDSLLDANSSTASHPHSFALDPNRSVLPASPLRSSPRRHRKGKSSSSRYPHPLANDTTDVFQESEDEVDDESEYEWGVVDRMRLWRHDALMQHLYETAAFWGDKILTWTNDPNDAFWLAQTYFMNHQYARAERLLTRPFSTAPPKPPDDEATQGLTNGHSGKGKGREQDMPPPPLVPRLPMGPGGMIEVPEDMQEGVSRLVDLSVACRYLAAQCQVRQGNWAEATEMLGESNPFRESGRSGPAIPNVDGGIKVEASMCYLRGILMQKLNRGDSAKECYMEALALDVKCYDAFLALIDGELLTVNEEWDFIQGLAYKEQTSEDAAFVQLMYTSRLRKYKHAVEHELTRRRLVEEYKLGDNPDVLYSFADALYSSFKWADCYEITSRILNMVAIHKQTMNIHVACMYHLEHLHSKLFLLAHELVEREPENPASWYAVGVWYLASAKYPQARQYFSKTSLMDPRHSAAWVAFGHTFSLEGEHDHAVTAYSTCARMFTGTHMPLMFVGMEHIILSNFALADEALHAANTLCDGDPLLMNECGVMAYNHGDYQGAADLFVKALDVAGVTQSSERTWCTTYMNLGTAYRKLKRYAEAHEAYQKVLDLEPRNAMALGFMGMVLQLMGNLDAAIVKYHEALSIDPINNQMLELLNLALDRSTMAPVMLSEAQVDAATRRFHEQKMLVTMKQQKGKERATDEMVVGFQPQTGHVDEANSSNDMSVG